MRLRLSLKSTLVRWDERRLCKAFNTWICVVLARVEKKVVHCRCMRRMRLLKLRLSLRKWMVETFVERDALLDLFGRIYRGLCDRRLMIHSLRYWGEFVSRRLHARTHVENVFSKKRIELVLSSLRCWYGLVVHTRESMETLCKRRQSVCCARVLEAWVHVHVAERDLKARLRAFLIRWTSRCVLSSFVSWCTYCRALKAKRLVIDLIQKRHVERALCRSFTLWRSALAIKHLEELRDGDRVGVVNILRRRTDFRHLQRRFAAWKRAVSGSHHVSRLTKPRVLKRDMTLRYVWKEWRNIVKTRLVGMRHCQSMLARHNKRIVTFHFNVWLSVVMEYKSRRSAINALILRSKRVNLAPAFAAWKLGRKLAIMEKASARESIARERSRLLSACFSSWQYDARKTRRLERSRDTLSLRRRRRCLLKSFGRWIYWCSEELNKKSSISRAVAKNRYRISRRAMRRWKEFISSRKIADSLRSKIEGANSVLKRTKFAVWKALWAHRKSACTRANVRRQHMLFECWRRNASFYSVQRQALFAWKALPKSNVMRSANRATTSALVRAEGSLNDAYSKVLEECSALEGMVQKLDEQRRGEMNRMAQDSAMINFTLNELGFQSALINMDLTSTSRAPQPH